MWETWPKDSRFSVVHFKTDEACVAFRVVAFPRERYCVTLSANAYKLQNLTFTWNTQNWTNSNPTYPTSSSKQETFTNLKHLQFARPPFLRNSSSTNFSLMPVFSHILRISDMHRRGFRLKCSFPAWIVRLCCDQSHRKWRCWLSSAEKAYMLQKSITARQ